jgi:hypothetical protein
LGWEEAVQDEEHIGTRLVCFGDKLVSVHSVRSRSGEVAVARLVIDLGSVCFGKGTHKV